MAEATNVTIRIDKAKAERLDEIVSELEKLGLAQVQRHARFMMVNGRIDADQIDKLRSVEGIESVREDQTFRTLSP